MVETIKRELVKLKTESVQQTTEGASGDVPENVSSSEGGS